MTSPVGSIRHRALTLPVVVVAGASLLLAACGSSSKTSNPPTPTVPTVPPAASPTSAATNASDASVTVKAANVPGVGTVLVNGNGLTLYVLESEKGGKVTCTSTTGCTAIWPPAVVPSGMSKGIAGAGVQASLLGTVNGPSGDVRLTYGGWPLYTFVNDKSAGTASGQGVKDQFGTWWVLSPSGAPIMGSSSTATTAPSSPATTAPASGGAGF